MQVTGEIDNDLAMTNTPAYYVTEAKFFQKSLIILGPTQTKKIFLVLAFWHSTNEIFTLYCHSVLLCRWAFYWQFFLLRLMVLIVILHCCKCFYVILFYVILLCFYVILLNVILLSIIMLNVILLIANLLVNFNSAKCHLFDRQLAYCHFENVILITSFWQRHFDNVILTTSFWQCHFDNAILTMPFWQCHFENIILKMSFWKCHYENVIMRMSFFWMLLCLISFMLNTI